MIKDFVGKTIKDEDGRVATIETMCSCGCQMVKIVYKHSSWEEQFRAFNGLTLVSVPAPDKFPLPLPG